ncbi:MAG TPA: EAL domain-containing protein [Caulobacter sp.]|nr:EAL domain-containing protein [Caulobacter sp.]
MPTSSRTLLGFAFTAGDLLLELDRGGTILEAVGATQAVLGAAEVALPGTGILALIHETDRPLVRALLASIEEGQRRGPVAVRLARVGEHGAALTLRSLPGNGGRLSCAITRGPVPVRPPGDGLHRREGFEGLARGLGEAARATGRELELAMVELSGLAATRAALAPKAAEALDAEVGGALRSEIGALGAAARLGGERFALVREAGAPAALMARCLTRALAAAGAEVNVQAHAAPLDVSSPSRLGRAMRYALDDFIAEGLTDQPPQSMAEAMNRSVRRTLARAGELGAAVSQRRFTLAFQPVVRMSDGGLHHHEALVRFEDNASPFAMVRMAEEFDLIEELDRAVIEQAIRRLRADRTGDLRLAVNVSGRSIGSSPFVEGLQRLIAATPDLSTRLIFEITESAAIDDLALANRHIQALREAGSLVCLDDFGSGAASLAYLQNLTVDIVKIDGRYVRDLAGGGRDAALVRHLVTLCADLKVRTVAEMVETREAEDAARAAGIDLAQGWWFGRPADTPEAPVRHAAMPARRKGASEDWR